MKSIAFLFICCYIKRVEMLTVVSLKGKEVHVLKIAIIADDLTGANDSGVQLTKNGMSTSVILDLKDEAVTGQDAVVVDTDSRSVPTGEAYERVKKATEFFQRNHFDMIYKKLDSTLRGNLGIELDAIYDTVHPDFVIIAPAFPMNGRITLNGFHYLNDRLLHQTEVALDPKTPVTESYIPKLLLRQTKRKVEVITYKELHLGTGYLKQRLREFKEQNIPYIVFDSSSDDDLKAIVDSISQTSYKVVWAGSAGLVHYLPLAKTSNPNKQHQIPTSASNKSVLLVIGSVSKESRKQLEFLLDFPSVEGIKLRSEQVVSNMEERDAEKRRVINGIRNIMSSGKHIVLYSSGEPEDIRIAVEVGMRSGLNRKQVSNEISVVLGEIAVETLNNYDIRKVVLTGGDTAKQVCTQIGAERLELVGEVETGVPIGRLTGAKELYAVTKAGSFGTEKVLLHSVQTLTGERCL